MTTFRGRSRGNSSNEIPLMLLFAVALVSFFAGSILMAHVQLGSCGALSHHGSAGESHRLDAKVEELAQKRLLELQKTSPKCDNTAGLEQVAGGAASISSNGKVEFPQSTGRFAVGMARTSKIDFFHQLDIGVPMDIPKSGDSDVILIYGSKDSLPPRFEKIQKESSDSVPAIDMEHAVQNCDMVNVVLTDHGNRNQCVALVPQYESYHIQKWMRTGPGGLDHTQPLKLVGRGYQTNGRNNFDAPRKKDLKKNWDMLEVYLKAFPDIMTELKPMVQKVATPGRTVTVMVCNFGQSELLVNFVCASRARNIDISSVLVFATDPETKEVAEGLGLTAFYDERNFGEMPQEAAGGYGDRKFTAMMTAKVMCVQLVSALEYNVLFQDVDIVYYKSPIPYFEDKDSSLQEFDMMFQDDGGHTVRYSPYSANSGFYYVRYNRKTEHFFSALLLNGDVILKTDSHQQALIALMSEHVSLYGLRVKVFPREEDEFPGGYQFHMKSGKYMKALFDGKKDPYLFHMSWTKNKDNKLLFLQQISE
ncbi:MAG: hypothetical protein SGILL_010654, partial [Bacillariaceae sp.]